MGAKTGTAGADDHRHCPLGDLLPLPVALGVAEVAVQHGHAAEPRAEAIDRLRRQADLGHQHDRLPPEVDYLLDGLDVDLGLAAAGDAVDEDRLVASRVHRVEDRLQRAAAWSGLSTRCSSRTPAPASSGAVLSRSVCERMRPFVAAI